MTRRRLDLSILTLLGGFLSLAIGCAVARPIDSQSYRYSYQTMERLENAKAEKPEEVIEQTNTFLATRKDFDEPVGAYQEQFTSAMEKVSNVKRADVVPEGVGHVYEWQARAMAHAYLAQAKAYVTRGDVTRAERAARNSWEIGSQRSLSPVWSAEHGIRAFQILGPIYEKSTDFGRLWVSQLFSNLNRDYLASEQAQSDRLADQELTKSGERLVQETNSLIARANDIRSEQTAQTTLMVATVALTITGAVLQQGAISNVIAAGGSAATISQMQSLQQQTLEQGFGLAVDQFETLQNIDTDLEQINPTQNFQMVQQLIDRRRGVDPHREYEAFIGKVRAGTHDSALIAKSNRLSEDVGSLRHVFRTVDLTKLSDAELRRVTDEAAEFTRDFDGYAAEVERHDWRQVAARN